MFGRVTVGRPGAQMRLPFLGRGWSFPPRFATYGEGVDMVEGTDDIGQSLFILLSTAPGERIMRPTYGCDLSRFVFRSLTTSLATEIADLVSTAIRQWEPRIDLLSVDVVPGPAAALVHIDVAYAVRQTNVRTNLVFPFYLIEATLVEAP